MSIRIMSHVWDYGPNDKAEVLILLALADFCDDRGRCWPAVATIAEKARMTERGARKVILRLVESGWVEIDERKGRNGSNLYTVNTLNHVPPECSSPPNHVPKHPEPRSEYPEPRSPKPSRTINEPSVNSSSREIASILERWASPEAVKSFMSYRRKHKAGALTMTAAKRLAGNLQKIFNAGGDTNDALGLAEERGWRSVEADWYFNAKGKSNGQSNHNTGGSAARQENRPNPALERLARIAGVGEAQGNGGA